MDAGEIEAYLAAGKIAAAVRAAGQERISVGTRLADVAEFVESEIARLGGKPAFPTNLSRNSEAAHYTPAPGDSAVFSEGDVVKLDLGVSVNGFVADTAVTKILSEEREKLEMKLAAEAALEAAEKALRPGAPVSEIGAAIEGAITSRGFRPIYNLTGHLLKQFDLHAGLSIPNYRSGHGEIPEECAVAIEPFATNGDGYVEDGPLSEIFLLAPGRRPRLPIERELFAKIGREFSTLPFASRWLLERERALLKRLALAGAVHNYPILRERSGGFVAQAEHTFLISPETGVVATTRDV